MMFIPNKPEIWDALREAGLEEDARKLDRLTGFGLWMFWVYFIYLALFGIIALVWPSYPGIALTNWITETLPYGVFAVSRADLLAIDSPLSHGVVMHITVWQVITIIWLWGCSFWNTRAISKSRKTTSGKALAPKACWNDLGPARYYIFIFVCFDAISGCASDRFIGTKHFCIAAMDFTSRGFSPFEPAEVIIWASLPFAAWFVPLLLIIVVWDCLVLSRNSRSLINTNTN